MGRYHPSIHDSAIRCKQSRCGVQNAPENSEEYEAECWRCGESLDSRPEIGDVVDVDIVDVSDDGQSVAKTESGFVLFLDEEVTTIEATVEVTEIKKTSGEATLIT